MRRLTPLVPDCGYSLPLTPVSPVSTLLSLPISQLKEPVKIHSRKLDTNIWLVPPECAGQRFDAPVYSAAECSILLVLAPSDEELRAIYLTKTVFQGDLIVPDEPDTLRRLYASRLEQYHKLEQDFAQGKVSEIKLLQLARQLSFLLNRLDLIESEGTGNHELP